MCLKAKYDETLKELLANKQFLARIMKRFVSEFSDYSVEDIENKYIESESVSVLTIGVERNRTNIEGIANDDATLNEGRIFYDIIFKAYYPGNVIILRVNDHIKPDDEVLGLLQTLCSNLLKKEEK